MSSLTWDIQRAISSARETLSTAQKSAVSIGNLARDPMILRNMSHSDLADIKKQLRDFNASTWEWK